MINGSMKGYFTSARGLRQGYLRSPLLFVICMDYLSRVIGMMSNMKHFHFIPNVKFLSYHIFSLQMYLILCCKGEFSSVYLLLRAFKLFSDSPGLKANVNKSDIYYCAIDEDKVQRVVNVCGLHRSQLPFRYLEVPICSKRVICFMFIRIILCGIEFVL